MSSSEDNVGNILALFNMMGQKAPDYINLLTATTEAEFEKAFNGFLEKAIIQLESNKANYANLDEEGLSGVLVAALSMPGLSVTQETHTNGHVDITVEADHCIPARKKLAEAKIYQGPQYHYSGLKQLLGRYTTGREGPGLLIVYFRKDNIARRVTSLRERMDKDLPSNQQGLTSDHVLKWSFLSTHTHSCGEDLQVGHVCCNLYIA